MSRYIDADALYKAFEKIYYCEMYSGEMRDSSILTTFRTVCRKIDSIPTADVVEVVHGEWFPIDVGDCCYRCSVCNFVRDAYLLEEDNYCPHCGARMDGRYEKI